MIVDGILYDHTSGGIDDLDASSSNESRDKTNHQKVTNDTSSRRKLLLLSIKSPRGSLGGRGCPGSSQDRMSLTSKSAIESSSNPNRYRNRDLECVGCDELELHSSSTQSPARRSAGCWLKIMSRQTCRSPVVHVPHSLHKQLIRWSVQEELIFRLV